MAEKTNDELNTGGTPNQKMHYQTVSAKGQKIFETMVALLDDRNPLVRLGAAKALMNKILPDLKGIELTGEDGGPIRIRIISGGDYLSAIGKSLTASTAGTTYGSPKVQGSNLAQKSKKDDNSDKPAS